MVSREISHAESENGYGINESVNEGSKLCSAPVLMGFDGDDIHVLVAMVSFGIDKGEQMRC